MGRWLPAAAAAETRTERSALRMTLEAATTAATLDLWVVGTREEGLQLQQILCMHQADCCYQYCSAKWRSGCFLWSLDVEVVAI